MCGPDGQPMMMGDMSGWRKNSWTHFETPKFEFCLADFPQISFFAPKFKFLILYQVRECHVAVAIFSRWVLLVAPHRWCPTVISKSQIVFVYLKFNFSNILSDLFPASINQFQPENISHFKMKMSSFYFLKNI